MGGGAVLWRPADTPADLLIAVSERGAAPPGHPSPTAYLARSLADSLGHPELPIVRATQVHGTNASLVERPFRPGEVIDIGESDVLITQQKNVALVVQTADCLPVLIAGDGGIAAVHAGWRGLAVNVVESAAGFLEGFGVPWPSLRAWVGPSIGPCCYEVGEEVASEFPEEAVSRASDGSIRLDLRIATRMQLANAGFAPDKIDFHPACTRCGGEQYASFRRDGGRAGRMIALIARLG